MGPSTLQTPTIVPGTRSTARMHESVGALAPVAAPTTAAGPRVLVVTTSRQLAEEVELHRPPGGVVRVHPDVMAAQSALAHEPADVIVVDLDVVTQEALEFLLSAPQLGGHTHVLAVSAHETLEDARAAAHGGADFCILRPYGSEDLRRALARAAEAAATHHEMQALRILGESPADTWLIGRSPTTRRLRDFVVRAAAQRSPVLVLGEEGVGKKRVAQALHLLSTRHRRPFAIVSCAGRSAAALEAELFGSGQVRGALAEVSGGTLVLDGVDQLGPPLMSRLAQVIALAGKGNVPDFRLVATMAERPANAITPVVPRYDLLGQVRAVPVVVPPLRDRLSDIPLLVSHFRTCLARQLGVVPPLISPDQVSMLMSYHWPGNVRQLEEYVARLFLAPAGTRLTLDTPDSDAGDGGDRDPLTLVQGAIRQQWTMADLEREYMLRVLDSVDGHRSNAAEILGIDRRTLYRKLREFQAAGAVTD